MKSIPESKWEWYGNAGHFVCGRWCRFHLTTKVGNYVVSTVGEYIHPRHSGGSEQIENEWISKNWPGEDIGYDRKFETMVFTAVGQCKCGCGMPKHDGSELACRGYNDHESARKGHMELCHEFARNFLGTGRLNSRDTYNV